MHVEGGEGKVPASKTFGTELAGGGGGGGLDLACLLRPQVMKALFSSHQAEFWWISLSRGFP